MAGGSPGILHGGTVEDRTYAIDDFIGWYCSEPRLAFGKHVVLRYRIELESRLLDCGSVTFFRIERQNPGALLAPVAPLSGRP